MAKDTTTPDTATEAPAPKTEAMPTRAGLAPDEQPVKVDERGEPDRAALAKLLAGLKPMSVSDYHPDDKPKGAT